MKAFTTILATIAVLSNAAVVKSAEVKKPLPQQPVKPPAPAPAPNWFGGDGASGRPLVITAEANDKVMSELEEDLMVMSRVLKNAVRGEGSGSHNAMGISIPTPLFGGTAAPHMLYVDGHGAIFLLEVNHPLREVEVKEKDVEEEEETSTEWENARRELSQGSDNIIIDLQNLPFGAGGGGSYSFDERKVDELKANLISALKNASHIRNLKPEEFVTVVVTGRSHGSTSSRIVRKGGTWNEVFAFSRGGGGRSDALDRMMLRAKVSDIRAFQGKSSSLEDFQKVVTVTLR